MIDNSFFSSVSIDLRSSDAGQAQEFDEVLQLCAGVQKTPSERGSSMTSSVDHFSHIFGSVSGSLKEFAIACGLLFTKLSHSVADLLRIATLGAGVISPVIGFAGTLTGHPELLVAAQVLGIVAPILGALAEVIDNVTFLGGNYLNAIDDEASNEYSRGEGLVDPLIGEGSAPVEFLRMIDSWVPSQNSMSYARKLVTA